MVGAKLQFSVQVSSEEQGPLRLIVRLKEGQSWIGYSMWDVLGPVGAALSP